MNELWEVDARALLKNRVAFGHICMIVCKSRALTVECALYLVVLFLYFSCTKNFSFRQKRTELHCRCTHLFHSSVICQTTGPQPLPKRLLHLMRSRASSFKWEYPLLSPRSSSNFLRLLPRLLVTSVRPFVYSHKIAFFLNLNQNRTALSYVGSTPYF
jgi:hypothetical protein